MDGAHAEAIVSATPGVGHLEPPHPVQRPHIEFPQVWTRVPEGAPSVRKQILPQRNRPERGCREEHEFREPGPVGPIWRRCVRKPSRSLC